MLYEKWIKSWKAALAENFFLRSAVLVLGAGLILNATVFREETRIVVVPPTLTKEFWIDKSKASPEYLEQMSVFIATLTGNLAPRNAEYNVDVLLGYIDAERLVEVKDDLKAQAQYIKKNNISQAFYPDSSSINPKEQTAMVEGRVTRHIGDIKVSEEKMRVNLSFKVKDYKMRVTSLSVDYPGRRPGEKKKAEEAAFPTTDDKKNPESDGKKKTSPEDKKK